MLGFKIFDRDDADITDTLFDLAEKDNLALEIALYGNNIENFTKRVTQDSRYVNNPNKSIHLNYLKYLGNNISQEKHWNNFMTELEQAQNLLINKAIIHYQHPHNAHEHLENWKINNIVKNLYLLYNSAKSHNFTFYIENTYIHERKYYLNNLNHHKLLWDTALDLGMQDHIGLCLDWGHVKSFGETPLVDWLGYARFLRSRGMQIYMHVHDNNAIKDLHCSFLQAEEQELHLFNHPDDKPYIEILKDVQKEFKKEPLILEYNSNIAKEHYFWTKNKLGL